ncbi:hypothetical protein MRX96_016263 [Rhipicephalus microplus]
MQFAAIGWESSEIMNISRRALVAGNVNCAAGRRLGSTFASFPRRADGKADPLRKDPPLRLTTHGGQTCFGLCGSACEPLWPDRGPPSGASSFSVTARRFTPPFAMTSDSLCTKSLVEANALDSHPCRSAYPRTSANGVCPNGPSAMAGSEDGHSVGAKSHSVANSTARRMGGRTFTFNS